jgi:hypothetical protein
LLICLYFKNQYKGLLTSYFPFLFYTRPFIYFFPLLLCWVGVHCGIYKGSYNVSNISYLNSPPPWLPCIPSPPFMEQFQQISFLHLRACVHIFFPITSSLPVVPTLPLGQELFHPPVLWFCRREKRKGKKKNMTLLLIWDKDSYIENFLVIFPLIYVLYHQLV